jgi:hypothetical protein
MKNLGMKFNFKRFVFFIFGGAILGLIIFNIPKTLDAEGLKQFNRDLKNYNVKLQIFNPAEEVIADFMVSLADDDYKKMYGLMNLKEMPKNYGMLFDFNKIQVVTMWMKNTLMPLDMLFIDEHDVIVNIKHDAVVQSLEIISSVKPVKKVLEINGGLSKKLKIEIGYKIKTSR